MISKPKLLLDFKITRKSRIPSQPRKIKYYLDALDQKLDKPGNDYLGGGKPSEIDREFFEALKPKDMMQASSRVKKWFNRVDGTKKYVRA